MPAAEGKIESIIEEMLNVYEELNLFYDISSSLIYTSDLEKTLDLILHKAMDILEADKSAITVLDDSKNTWKILRGWMGGSPISPDPSREISIGGTILEKAINTKKGMIVNDITKSGNDLNPLIARKSLLCVPLHGKNGIIGILTLGDRTKTGFSSKDLKLSTVLSSQAALVIENARLIQAHLEKENSRP
ncbi:MAG: GAF domain-containing protein [Deltaproteobacteria bacterium]|nr:GAF domain-containing protein [Deltaproteobacteria bacterium]